VLVVEEITEDVLVCEGTAEHATTSLNVSANEPLETPYFAPVS
jgi:hypothetical protein